MKYKVGDEIVLRYKVLECDERFGWCRISDNGYLSDDHIEKYAAYAAKAAPDGWEPKVGERVLVEGKVVLVEAESGYWISAHHGEQFAVGRSAIIGPAPKRARFAWDVVFSKSLMLPGEIHEYEDDFNEWRVVFSDCTSSLPEADLLTLDEARERLAR